MTVRSVPIFLQAGSHPAEETRLALGSMLGTATGSFAGGVGSVDRAHGVVNASDFAVTQRAAGANMSVDVAAGSAWVRGTQSADQGAYNAYNDATVNLSVAASDATNPRIDLVVIRVQDAFYSGATNSASVTIVTGTAAASPTDPTLPANALVLARVRVPAASTSVVTANITDVRTRAASGSESYTRTGFKNAIMNGDFRINQRGFTSTTSSGTYGFDRWVVFAGGGTNTYSSQSFAVGVGPAAGYEPEKYARVVSTGQSAAGDLTTLLQYIEDVRTFAGSTVTVSFYAKAATSTLAAPAKIAVELEQSFGSGGSPSASVATYGGSVSLSTSWQRYSVTMALPSISGKTIGTTANTSSCILRLWTSAGSTFNSRTGTLGIQSNTFDIWGVQVERGGFATSFEERPLQVELAMCQRYYEKTYDLNTAPGTSTSAGAWFQTGSVTGGGTFVARISFAVPKRVPTYAQKYYAVSGTADIWDYERSGVSSSTTVNTGTGYEGTGAMMASMGVGGSWVAAFAYGHWTVSAEF